MSKSKAAAAVMKEHKMNCAQTVLTAFCEELGISRNLALRIAAGFGGGMGRTGQTCGTVTGAYIVLGLAQQISPENPREAIDKTYKLITQFNRRFVKKYGTMTCKELIGLDISTKQGQKEAHRREVFTTLCPKFVGDSVKILESLLKNSD